MGKRIAIGILIGGILIASIARIVVVNQEVQSASEKTYKVGEEVPLEDDVLQVDSMNGYSITVNTAEVLAFSEFIKKYDGNEDDIPEGDRPEKVYDINVTIKNTDNRDTGINLQDIYIQENMAVAGFDIFCYRIANAAAGYINTNIAIREGTEVQLQLTYGLVENNFTKKSWNNMENIGMKLIVSLYPEKKMIYLK